MAEMISEITAEKERLKMELKIGCDNVHSHCKTPVSRISLSVACSVVKLVSQYFKREEK